MWVIWELVVVGSLPTRPKSYNLSGGYKEFKKAAVQEGLHPTGSIRPRGVCSPGCWLSSPGAVALTLWLLLYCPRAPFYNQLAAPSGLNQGHRWSCRAVTWDDVLPITLSGRSLPSPWSLTCHPHLSGTLFYIYLLLLVIIITFII